MFKKLSSGLLAALLLFALAACGQVAPEGGRVLRVAMECGYAPYNWTQSDDANGAVKISDSAEYALGYDVMMAQYLADKLGYTLEIVKMDWDSLIPAVQSGTVDCAIAGQSITSARLEMVDFTTPYYYASIVALVRTGGSYVGARGVSDLADAKGTSQINTVWYDTCLPQIPDVDLLAAQESAPAMLAALSSGRCDVVVTDMPTAIAACALYPNFTLLDFSEGSDPFVVSEEEINIGISLKKRNTKLLGELNGALAKLTEEDFTKMMNEAIAVLPL